jgi:glycosyltransferase involved in cell wall biosynthesis
MTVHLDVSQLVQDPRRSGIQRAERELIRHWPGPAPLVPCMFDGAQLRDLPTSVFDVLCADAPPGGIPVERLRLERHIALGAPSRPDRLLSAELFLDRARSAFYAARRGAPDTYWLVYDFIPWLNPGWFGPGSIASLMPFLRALRGIDKLAFISERTRQDCEQRIVRRPMSGPVIPMGADGLGLERQRFGPERRSFVMLGTIEHRKNALPVLLAMQAMWDAGSDCELVMIGSLAPEAKQELALMRRFAAEGRPFRHLTNLPDAGVREELRRARGMLFPSIGEGFGIPPMEALHAGIPVVVSSGLPAISGLTSEGQIRLEEVTPATVAAAVTRLARDDAAAGLWREAATLRLPGWADFARRMASWVQA